MKNLKNYNDYSVNEGVIFASLVLGVLGILAYILVHIIIVKPTVVGIRRYINKLKSMKQFRNELSEILSDITSEQKKQLMTYVKNSVFADWDIESTANTDTYFRDDKVEEEKNRLLDIFEGEQREKLIQLLDSMEYEILNQVTKDGDEWGVDGPDYDYNRKSKLDIKSLKGKSRKEEERERIQNWKRTHPDYNYDREFKSDKIETYENKRYR